MSNYLGNGCKFIEAHYNQEKKWKQNFMSSVDCVLMKMATKVKWFVSHRIMRRNEAGIKLYMSVNADIFSTIHLCSLNHLFYHSIFFILPEWPDQANCLHVWLISSSTLIRCTWIVTYLKSEAAADLHLHHIHANANWCCSPVLFWLLQHCPKWKYSTISSLIWTSVCVFPWFYLREEDKEKGNA